MHLPGVYSSSVCFSPHQPMCLCSAGSVISAPQQVSACLLHCLLTHCVFTFSTSHQCSQHPSHCLLAPQCPSSCTRAFMPNPTHCLLLTVSQVFPAPQQDSPCPLNGLHALCESDFPAPLQVALCSNMPVCSVGSDFPAPSHCLLALIPRPQEETHWKAIW